MTGKQLDALLARVGWYRGTLARFIGCNERLIRYMAADEQEIPAAVAQYLERLDHWHATHPAPTAEQWRRRGAR